MQDEKYENIKIFHHCSPHYHKQANACFLMGAFMIVCYHYTAEDAWGLFQSI
jgi:cell division cycle 14